MRRMRQAIVLPLRCSGVSGYLRAILVESNNGNCEWARIPDSNLVLFPRAYREETTYELPNSIDGIEALAEDLNRGRA